MAHTPAWWLTRDGDVACLALYRRHYSRRDYADGRRHVLFVGPGEKVVLRTAAGDAVFVWRRFTDDCLDVRTGERQQGINCAIFRNERGVGSRDLIQQADAVADCIWSDRRHYTYVNPARVASGLPGSCFLAAGWRYVRHRGHRVRTKSGLLILERIHKGADHE